MLYDHDARSDFLKAAEKGDTTNVQQHLNACPLPPSVLSQALINAAMHGHLETAVALIPFADPMAEESMALLCAVANGHLDLVRLLIPVSDPAAGGYAALENAAKMGLDAIVEALIPVSNPKHHQSMALRWAAKRGHLSTLQLLLPVSDLNQAFSDSLALRDIDALENLAPHLTHPQFERFRDKIQALLPYPTTRVDGSLLPVLRQRLEAHEAQKQAHQLEQSVPRTKRQPLQEAATTPRSRL